LKQEFEPHDAIDTARHNSVNALLCQPLIDLINAETNRRALFFKAWTEVSLDPDTGWSPGEWF
jgi:hypothetical protein